MSESRHSAQHHKVIDRVDFIDSWSTHLLYWQLQGLEDLGEIAQLVLTTLHYSVTTILSWGQASTDPLSARIHIFTR